MFDQLSAQQHLLAQGLLVAQTATTTSTPATLGGLIGNFQGALSGAGTAIAGVAVVAAGLMIPYHAIMRNLDHDGSHVAYHTAAMKKVVVGTVVAGSVGLISHVAAGFLS